MNEMNNSRAIYSTLEYFGMCVWLDCVYICLWHIPVVVAREPHVSITWTTCGDQERAKFAYQGESVSSCATQYACVST